MRAGGKQAGHDRARGLAVGQRPNHLSAVVEPDRVRRIDDDLALEQARVLRKELPDLVEPERQDDDVCDLDGIVDRSSLRARTQLVREANGMRLVPRGQDDGLVARYEMTGDG